MISSRYNTNKLTHCDFACSQRAENVLKSAQDVVQSLDEASAAQFKAEEAIKQSSEDISLARADLDEVNECLW